MVSGAQLDLAESPLVEIPKRYRRGSVNGDTASLLVMQRRTLALHKISEMET